MKVLFVQLEPCSGSGGWQEKYPLVLDVGVVPQIGGSVYWSGDLFYEVVNVQYFPTSHTIYTCNQSFPPDVKVKVIMRSPMHGLD